VDKLLELNDIIIGFISALSIIVIMNYKPLGHSSSVNHSSQKVPPFYEGVGSIPDPQIYIYYIYIKNNNNNNNMNYKRKEKENNLRIHLPLHLSIL
jgi:hypothetical protein